MAIFTSIHKKTPPARLTFKNLYLLYKGMYENGQIIKNGSAYKRMMSFKSKFITLL